MPRTPHNPSPSPIHRIAIIGGGPCGLATLARFCRFHPTPFSIIDLFEQRAEVGGVWNYTDVAAPLVKYTETTGKTGEPFTPSWIHVPLDSPYHQHAQAADEPIQFLGSDGIQRLVFPSPVYPSLTSNLPKELMQFYDFPYNEGTELFPHHSEVLKYIQGYFKHLGIEERRQSGRIDRGGVGITETVAKAEAGVRVWFGKKVRKVRKVQGKGWRVIVKNVDLGGGADIPNGTDEIGGGEEERWYDAVVISGGRYSVPYVPDIPGLKEWVLTGGGKRRVEHSMEFKEKNERYRGKKILVVGSHISANEVIRLLTPVASLPIYQSMRDPQPTTDGPGNSSIPLPAISHLEETTGLIHFHAYPHASRSVASTPLANIDLILFCTGYVLTAPFLPRNHPTIPTPSDQGTHVPNLFLHCFSRADPTLAWVGLPYRVLPFPLGELQAAVIGRVWAGTLGMDEVEQADAEGSLERELEKLQHEEAEEVVRNAMSRVLQAMEGGGREQGAFTHSLEGPRDLWMMERLERLCQLADNSDCGGEGLGVMPWYGDYPVFSPYLKRLRLRIGEIRNQYDKAMTEGRKVTTLAQLGFGEEEVLRDLKVMN